MIRFKGYSLFLLLAIVGFTAYSQIPTLKQYTVADGLPTNEVYHLFQDSKGVIWAGTAIGAYRFNGKRFVAIDNPGETKSMIISEIYEDKKKHIWLISLYGNIYKYDKVAIPFRYNSQIQNKYSINKVYVRNTFFPFSDSSAELSVKERGGAVITPRGAFLSKYANQMEKVVIDFRTKNPFISYSEGLFENRNVATISKVKLIDESGKASFIDLSVTPTHVYAARLRNGNKVFSINKDVYVVGKQGQKHYQMEDAVTGLYQDREDNVWVSINGLGARCYASEDFDRNFRFLIFPKEIVTSIFEDREGSYWFATLNSGIFYTPSLSFINYTAQDGLMSDRVSKVMCVDGDVWVGYADGFVSKISKNGSIQNIVNPFNKTAYVKGFSRAEDGSILVSSDILYKIRGTKLSPYEKELTKGNSNPNYALLPRSISKSRDGGFWIASTRGFKKVLDDKIVYDSFEDKSFTGIVYYLTEDRNGNLWIFSTSLYLLKNGKIRKVGERNPLLNNSIIKGKQNPYDGRVWMGTKTNGILILDKDKLVQINAEKGLQSSSITGFDFAGNQVWVSSNSGVECITIVSKEPLKYTIKHYNTSHGLISTDVRDVCVNGRYVYFATMSGLSRFDRVKGAFNRVPPPVEVTSLKVNDRMVDFSQPITLKYDQNFVDISFHALTFKRVADVMYKYRVDGLSDRWFYTTEESLKLYKLNPGDYKVSISAMNNDGIWSKQEASISFSIAKPFWNTFWFYGICLIFIVLMVYAVFLTRLRIVQKINMYERKGNLWRNQSLSLQMNPHFIFNTLNSIQLYILKCDVDSSLHYLSRFSSLMRKTLENSNKINITLKEELDALELYLELEALRCEGKFSYSIECDSTISLTETYIPTLLIQPYVENAIWHGIMPKTSNGHIQVSIKNAGAFIKCSVVDDGIGRVKSYEIQSMSATKKHKSFATKITGRRMEILRSLYSKDFSFEYVDKYDNDGNALGTEVILIIPRDFMSSKHVNQFAD